MNTMLRILLNLMIFYESIKMQDVKYEGKTFNQVSSMSKTATLFIWSKGVSISVKFDFFIATTNLQVKGSINPYLYIESNSERLVSFILNNNGTISGYLPETTDATLFITTLNMDKTGSVSANISFYVEKKIEIESATQYSTENSIENSALVLYSSSSIESSNKQSMVNSSAFNESMGLIIEINQSNYGFYYGTNFVDTYRYEIFVFLLHLIVLILFTIVHSFIFIFKLIKTANI